MNAITTSQRQDDVPSVARVVLLVGLAGSFFANLASQVVGTHFTQGGADLTAQQASLIAATYTMSTFVGMVAAAPLERAIGIRKFFVASALLFSAFGFIQATHPSAPMLLAMRAFEGFTTGGFGPRALLAAFMLYKGGRLPAMPAVSTFLVLIFGAIGLVMFGASEAVLGLRGVFLVQFALSAVLVLAGLRWLPDAFERVRTAPVEVARVVEAVRVRHAGRRHRHAHWRSSMHAASRLP